MGGLLGKVLIGILADPEVNGVEASLEQFGKQLAAACLTAVYSFVVGYVLIVDDRSLVSLRFSRSHRSVPSCQAL